MRLKLEGPLYLYGLQLLIDKIPACFPEAIN